MFSIVSKFALILATFGSVYYVILQHFPVFVQEHSDVEKSVMLATKKLLHDLKGDALEHPVNLNVYLRAPSDNDPSQVSFDIQKVFALIDSNEFEQDKTNYWVHGGFVAIFILTCAGFWFLSNRKRRRYETVDGNNEDYYLDDVFENEQEFTLRKFRLRKLLADLPVLERESVKRPNLIKETRCVRCNQASESLDHVWCCPSVNMNEIKESLFNELKLSLSDDQEAESVCKLLGWDRLSQIDPNLSRGLIPVGWYPALQNLLGEARGRLFAQKIVPFAFEKVLFEKIWKPRCAQVEDWIQNTFDDKNEAEKVREVLLLK